jgi:hypothetical protein
MKCPGIQLILWSTLIGFASTIQSQQGCNLLYTNNFVLGDFDVPPEDEYGGSLITFFPEFSIAQSNLAREILML